MTDRLVFCVRLTPRAARDQVSGMVAIAGGRQAVAARVRAVPENGKANLALIQLLAKFLGVAKSKIEIISGTKSRLKTVRVSGDQPQAVARIAELARRETVADGSKKS